MKIRNRRSKGWFYLDNEYLNGYGKIFGAVGVAVYVSLCRHADNETQSCFPSMELIAEELNVSRNTVSKYLKLFEEKKIIATEREKDETGKWKNNIYYLLDKEEWEPHAQPLGVDIHAQPLTQPCTTNEKIHAQPLGNKDTQNTKDTHIKETHSEFGRFWEIYPRKELKKKAQEIWKKKKLNNHISEILIFLEVALRTDRWKKGYIPQPTTFLNGERWNDDLEAYNDKNYGTNKQGNLLQAKKGKYDNINRN